MVDFWEGEKIDTKRKLFVGNEVVKGSSESIFGFEKKFLQSVFQTAAVAPLIEPTGLLEELTTISLRTMDIVNARPRKPWKKRRRNAW